MAADCQCRAEAGSQLWSCLLSHSERSADECAPARKAGSFTELRRLGQPLLPSPAQVFNGDQGRVKSLDPLKRQLTVTYSQVGQGRRAARGRQPTAPLLALAVDLTQARK